jgi:DNA-binding transcriptional ArsR family regulator
MNFYKVFANPVRTKIIRCLGRREKNVSQIIDVCSLSQSAVSQHLKVLKDAGLVNAVKKGKEIYYSLSYKKSLGIANGLFELKKEVNGK